MTGTLGVMPKTFSSTVTSPTLSPEAGLRTPIWIAIATPPSRFCWSRLPASADRVADEDEAAAGAGDRTLEQDDLPLRVGLDHLEVEGGDLLVADPTGHRVPLNTRAGVAQAPMAPGLRWVLWAPWEAPMPLKLWRFMTPVKPLPLLTAVTSTSSPFSSTPAVSSWPTS